MLRLLALLSLLLCHAAGSPAFAVQPSEVLADPVMEARARALSAQLRCMVCQNQSIDDSDAELARDLRLLVRERLSAGDDDSEVIDYLVTRYGEFVLLKPRVSAQNFVLWGAPLAVLLLGGIAFFFYVRRKPEPGEVTELSESEKARIETILGKSE